MSSVAVKSRLDRLLNDAWLAGDFAPEDAAAFEEARRNFREAGAELLEQVTGDLWAYYRNTAAEYTAEQRSEYGIPELRTSADIWDEVRVTEPPEFRVGRSPYAPARCYISFEGEVSWEPEHGLQLVVEEGRRVCKVGPYDGHVTQAAAFADLSLLNVVFRS
jgi:hypothetical protein